MNRPRVLIVDDSREMAETVADNLREHGFEADAVTSGAEALERLAQQPLDAVLTDLRMPGMDGLDVLDAVRAVDAAVPVVIMTAFGGIDSAVEAMRRGAFHYVTKPFKLEVVRLLLDRAVAQRRLDAENRRLREEMGARTRLCSLLGQSPAMQDLFRLVDRVAAAANPVIVVGETGSGKELVARAIHARGPRAAKPFVAVNCAALPDTLLESELFGHVRGAFTGAQARRGLVAEADGGTLLLDEVGDMPLALQAKVLRLIETGELRAVGEDSCRRVDVRFIAATHRDLLAMVRDGAFREDLYYRLKVLPVAVPPLRDRKEDIPQLAAHFLERARPRILGATATRFTKPALQLLLNHPWPGNVRELEHVVERLVVTCPDEEIGPEPVLEVLDPAPRVQDLLNRASKGLVALADVQRQYIQLVMDSVGGNKTRAAEILGIDPSTIYRKERGPRRPG